MYKEVYYLPALFMGCGGSRKTSCDGLANKKQQQLASTITGNSVHHVVHFPQRGVFFALTDDFWALGEPARIVISKENA